MALDEESHLLAQPTQTLDSNDIPSHDALSPHPIKHRDPSAKQRRDLSGIGVHGNTNSGFRADRGILAVPAVAHNSVDTLVLAHLELASATLLARGAMAAVPGSTNPIADLPLGFR